MMMMKTQQQEHEGQEGYHHQDLEEGKIHQQQQSAQSVFSLDEQQQQQNTDSDLEQQQQQQQPLVVRDDCASTRIYFATVRMMVVIFVILSAAVLSYLGYKLARDQEKSEFEAKFQDFADEIIRSSVNNARNSRIVLESFSRTVTSLSIFANTTWPLLTLPHYETRSNDYLTISKAESITFAPIVSTHMREAYENYTVANHGWIQEGIDYEYLVHLRSEEEDDEQEYYVTAKEREPLTIAPGTNMEGFSILNKAKPIQPFIWTHAPLTHRAVPDLSDGPYVPIWQTYPPPRNSYVVNKNLLLVPEFADLIRSSQGSFTPTISDIFDSNFILFGNAQTIDVDPKSVILQPILQKMQTSRTNEIVAYMIVIKKWHQIFQDVLYNGAKPVIVVLRNSGTSPSCQNKEFTYEVDGSTGSFLGKGDLHDSRYDNLEMTSQLFSSSHIMIASGCNYTLHVYPTRELEEEYKTNLPMLVLWTVLAFCAMLAFGFCLYDRMTKQHQTNRLKAQAQQEQALLRIDHARQAASAERQLNEFIAHEVRNPLSAAMSACSFVSSAVQDLTALAESLSKTESELPSPSPTIPSPMREEENQSTPAEQPPPPLTKPQRLFSIGETAQTTSESSSTLETIAQDEEQPQQQPSAPPPPLFQVLSTRPSPQQDDDDDEEAPQQQPATTQRPQQQSAPAPPPLFQVVSNTPQENKDGSSQPPPPPLFQVVSTTPQDKNRPPPPAPLFHIAPPPQPTSNPSSTPPPLFAATDPAAVEPPQQVQQQAQAQPQAQAQAEAQAQTEAQAQAQAKAKAQQQQHQQQVQEQKESIMEDLHIIDSSLNFINELLRNMLDVQRAAHHQLKIDKAPTDVLRDILEPVDAMLYRRGKSDVKVLVECPPDMIVMTDRLRLKQVVLNLSRNSAKFVEKGYIKLKVVVVAETGHVQIWIEDSGPGIPEQKKGKLFAKFQESLDSLSQGTGLGLSLCKILIGLLGGDVWLDEQYDSGLEGRPGARFIIDLQTPPLQMDETDNGAVTSAEDITQSPRRRSSSSRVVVGNGTSSNNNLNSNSEPEMSIKLTPSKTSSSCVAKEHARAAAATEQKQSPQDLLPKELKVLFVDDDTVLRKLFVRAIRRIVPGWKTQEAASGEAALRLIDEFGDEGETHFDLIFMDQYMASTEKQLLGTETTQALRSKGVKSKICGLSANDMANDFFAAGADAFICKPLPAQQDILRDVLLELLAPNSPNTSEQAPPGAGGGGGKKKKRTSLVYKPTIEDFNA